MFTNEDMNLFKRINVKRNPTPDEEDPCIHPKIAVSDCATSFCTTCGEDFGQIISLGYFRKERKYLPFLTARMRNYQKTIDKLIPGLLFPEGEDLMEIIEKKFNHLKGGVGSFPNMKDVIYFILMKCEKDELANIIPITKSRRSSNILEKLFENNEDTDE